MARIVEIELDQATYRPGQPVSLSVTVDGGERGFSGKAVIELLHLGAAIDLQTVEVAAVPGAMTESRVALRPPRIAPRGYGVEVTLVGDDGETVAGAVTAFDVLARWSQAPRYGFLSSFSPEVDDGAIAEAARFLRRFHLNVVQFYDWMWRHYALLPPEDDFTDALGRPTSLRTVRAAIAAVPQIGAAAFASGAVYGAEPEYADKHREQVLFDADGKPISLAELFFIMDIAPESPWSALIVEEFAGAIRALGFDGIHLDQYGFPKGEIVNGAGARRNLEDDFPPLIDRARQFVREAKPAAGVIFNAVGNWPIERVAGTSQDAIYIEVWPPDIDDNDLRRLIREARALGRGQQVILAAYLTPFLDRPHAPESEAAALLATATIASAGGFHLLLGERSGILRDPYYPKFGTLRPGFVPRLRAYYDHLVRYQEWLTTADVRDWDVAIEGDAVSTDAAPGAVWAIARRAAAIRIVHLIDLRDQTGTEWNAPRTPWAAEKDPIVLRVPVERLVTGAMLVSPEFADGRPRPVECVVDGNAAVVEIAMPGPWASLVITLAR